VTSILGRVLALLAALAVASGALPALAQDACVGDCDNNGAVSINELLIGVNIALDASQLSRCTAFDVNGDGMVEINELLGAVRSAVDGCRAPEPTPTVTLEPTTTLVPEPTPTPTQSEYVAQASDFECLTKWTRIRHFRIANPLGHLDEALAVANGEMPPPYPIGTMIQLVPQEAMVKRGGGFFPDAHDWEFFLLSASSSGTEIVQRGRGEVVNPLAGVPCFTCHGAAPQTDFVCETNNGCVPLNLSVDLITLLQNRDPRCPAAAAVAAHP